MKYLLFSDLHLLKNPKSAYKTITKEWFDWVSGILKREKEEYEGVIFLGDWYDNWKHISVEELQFSYECMCRLVSNAHEIHMIPGNHDCAFRNNASTNSLSIFNDGVKVHVHTWTTVIERDGKDLVFVPWGDELNHGDVIFGHFDIKGFSMNNNHKSSHGYSYTDLLKYSDLIVSGHYHHAQKKKYKYGTIQYLGSPFQLNFGEAGKKSFIWEFDTNDLTLTPIENTFSPQYITIDKKEQLENSEGNFIRVSDPSIIREIDESKFAGVKTQSYKQVSNSLTEKINVDFEVDLESIIDEVVETEVPKDYRDGTKEKLKAYYNGLK